MLTAAVIAMSLALLLGLWLSVRVLLTDGEDGARPPPRLTGTLHATAGIATVICLGVALGGPKRGLATGASAFGWMSFALLAAALAGGATIAVLHMRRRMAPVLLVATHATVAIAGIVLLSAWWAAPAASGP